MKYTPVEYSVMKVEEFNSNLKKIEIVRVPQ